MSTTIIFDFSTSSDPAQWVIINDGVMGGLSAGAFRIAPAGHGVFTGHISLENNGGFSLLRCRLNVLLTGHKQFAIRVNGDGKAYQLRVKDNYANTHSYVAGFTAVTGWQTILIPFASMHPQYRGQQVTGPPYDGTQLQEIGFFIGNKKNEQFALCIGKIEAV